MSSARQAILVGCLVVAFGVAGLIAVAIVFIVQEKPLLEATLDAPNDAVVGEEIEIRVTLSNPHDEPVTLDSIDIDNSLLEGFQVLSIEPRPNDSLTVPLVDQRSWSFGKPLEPGRRAQVVFRLKPLRAGHFVGSLDVCNPTQDWVGLYADIVVAAR